MKMDIILDAACDNGIIVNVMKACTAAVSISNKKFYGKSQACEIGNSDIYIGL